MSTARGTTCHVPAECVTGSNGGRDLDKRYLRDAVPRAPRVVLAIIRWTLDTWLSAD